jgi:hypothetical protein
MDLINVALKWLQHYGPRIEKGSPQGTALSSRPDMYSVRLIALVQSPKPPFSTLQSLSITTDFLVFRDFDSRSWKHSYSSKIPIAQSSHESLKHPSVPRCEMAENEGRF